MVDIILHVAGVFPGAKQPLDDGLALLATSYRIVIGIGAGWLTARLAPARPMKLAIIPGLVGVVLLLVLGLGTLDHAAAQKPDARLKDQGLSGNPIVEG